MEATVTTFRLQISMKIDYAWEREITKYGTPINIIDVNIDPISMPKEWIFWFDAWSGVMSVKNFHVRLGIAGSSRIV